MSGHSPSLTLRVQPWPQAPWDPHPLCIGGCGLLCCGEGQGEVMPALCGVQRGVVKGIGEELVDEGAEGHAAAPARGEVLDVHVLRASGPEPR